ncbi:hypothetical protein PG987_002517 [Apiospora arundinis]
MPPPPHQKPENVLKRAQELIGVGQAPAALTLLHDHVTSKRSRNVPIASLEPVMMLLVELLVGQKKGKVAKDALYSYKNIAQNTNVATIELILKKFIELAVEKVTVAQQKADELTETSANPDDLEATETPESILLATVSSEQSKDRTDRAIITPWLKFLWEAYRTVLDILRNNARLEILYQSTAMQAFDFCLKHARKTEFRRLCELLRNHRHLETRFQQLNVAVELELWQEAFRSVEDIHTLLNLSKRPAKNIMMANYYEKLTRIFLVGENYLFHAAAWSRYYNLLRQSSMLVATGQSKKLLPFVLLSALSIPVISTSRSRGAMVDFDEARKNKNSRLTHLLGMSSAPTRAVLFRDALSKSLLKRARPEIRDLYNILEVDFHPLSICQKISPILAKIGADAEMEKYILPLQQVILTRLFQQLSQVYETVDLSFVESLAEFPDPYQISRGTIEKFIMNGNKKGDLSIRMDHATGVLSFDTDVFSSSKASHAGSAGGSAESETGTVQRLQNTPSEIVRSQLVRLAKCLHTTCFYIDPTYNEARMKAHEAALARAKVGADEEHHAILLRKDIIQKRKEEASELHAKREKEKARQKRLQEAALAEAEERRLVQEQKEREEKRLRDERERVRKEELKKQIADLKIGPNALDIDIENLDDLDSNRLRAMKLAQLEREKNDVNEKLRITGKRIDHLERALRKEESKKLPEDYAKQREHDIAAYEQMKTITLAESKAKHKESVELKHRLERLVPQYETYVKSMKERRRDEFEKRQRDAERELERQIAARKKEYRERKLREKREREEKERELREAEERAALEKEEAEKRAEAKRAEMAKLKEQREKDRQEALEKAALQARREEEAMARRNAEKSGPRREPVSMERTDSDSRRPALNLPGAGKWREREASGRTAPAPAADLPVRTASPMDRPSVDRADSNDRPSGDRPGGPPRLNLAGGKPSWREREAAKAAGGAPAPRDSAPPSRVASGAGPGPRRGEEPAATTPPAEPLRASAAPGKYVPRHLRDKQ